MMKRWINIILACVLMFSGCGTNNKTSGTGKKIAVTIFPEYDWIMNILGDNPADMDVTLLLDSGADLHSYQPSAQDIMKIADCDLFVCVGGESDAWVDDALKESVNPNLRVVKLLDVLGTQAKQEETLFNYLATLDDIPSKPRELTLKESKGKIPRDLNTMKENTAKVDTFAKNLKGSVDSVDFNLAGKGSKQFDDMKKSVNEFRRFVAEDYQSDPRGNISPEQHKALLSKTQDAIKKIKSYLDYKDHQFKEDPARRNDPKRQKREQPRILKNIEMLQELEKFYFEQSLQLPGIRYRDTSGDEKKREEFNKLMDEQRTNRLKDLASRQSKERYGEKGTALFNDYDKAEAAKIKSAANSKQKIEMAAKPEQKTIPKM